MCTDLFAADDDPPVLEGVIERFVFVNPDAGWSVASLKRARCDAVVVLGTLSGLRAGENVHLEGVWETDRRFARQSRVRAFRSLPPSTPEAIERYLGSGLVRGVGPVLAKRLVQHFRGEILDVLDREPGRSRVGRARRSGTPRSTTRRLYAGLAMLSWLAAAPAIPATADKSRKSNPVPFPEGHSGATVSHMKSISLSDVLELPVAERLRWVEAIWDSIAEVPEAVELTEAQRAELNRRLDEYEKDPDAGSPWSEVKERILKRG